MSLEPNPTLKQIDTYLKKGKRYNEYVKDMFYYGDYGEIPKSIKYMNNGKVSFILKEKLGENGESLLKYKKISSLIY